MHRILFSAWRLVENRGGGGGVKISWTKQLIDNKYTGSRCKQTKLYNFNPTNERRLQRDGSTKADSRNGKSVTINATNYSSQSADGPCARSDPNRRRWREFGCANAVPVVGTLLRLVQRNRLKHMLRMCRGAWRRLYPAGSHCWKLMSPPCCGVGGDRTSPSSAN